jgi:hypothetical protein
MSCLGLVAMLVGVLSRVGTETQVLVVARKNQNQNQELAQQEWLA